MADNTNELIMNTLLDIKEQVGSINTKVDSLNDKVDSNNDTTKEQIKELKKKQGELETKLTNIENKVNGSQDTIDAKKWRAVLSSIGTLIIGLISGYLLFLVTKGGA